MRRGIAVGLLVVLLWTGTGFAWNGKACACGGGVGSGGIGSRAKINVTANDLNLQALRNAQLQEELLKQQVRNAKIEGRLKRITLYAVLTGGVYALEQGFEKWEDRCEKVESEGRTSLVCPF